MATLKQLRAFIAVAETEKMSKAAKMLYLSQPTVSQIISDLEEEYGATFFKRLPKQLQVTPIGKSFWERALNVVTSYENLNQFMKTSNTIRPLRIGATLTIGDTMISEVIQILRSTHPDIETSVYIENTRILEQRLLHNELDIAFVEGIIFNASATFETLILSSKIISTPLSTASLTSFKFLASVAIFRFNGFADFARETAFGIPPAISI
jgi:DNA-binding transcriptional LysR family regulator